MTRFSINIDYSPERRLRNKKRMQAWDTFACADRVPVAYCLEPRFFTPVFKMNYQHFFKDVETQYELQLKFFKYRVENIPEDFCQGTGIAVYPYFDNVVTASAFGAEVHYPDNETLHATPCLRRVDDIDRLRVPDTDSGLRRKVLDWWDSMRTLAEETEVTFNRTEKGRVVAGPLAEARLGPHTVAVDLAGENFYQWMSEFPHKCHELLDKITKGILRTEECFRKIDPRPRGAFGLAEDSVQVCSAGMFREFCIPYDDVLFNRFGSGLPNGRGMHMCGNSAHLLESLVRDLRITSFNLFGCKVPPETAAEKMGGKVRLWGNIDPVLLLNGSKTEVKEAARKALEAMAPCGGYMLGDGANICPGTPVENLAAMVEASEEYGPPSFKSLTHQMTS